MRLVVFGILLKDNIRSINENDIVYLRDDFVDIERKIDRILKYGLKKYL